jgi:hypothetical protein
VMAQGMLLALLIFGMLLLFDAPTNVGHFLTSGWMVHEDFVKSEHFDSTQTGSGTRVPSSMQVTAYCQVRAP